MSDNEQGGFLPEEVVLQVLGEAERDFAENGYRSSESVGFRGLEQTTFNQLGPAVGFVVDTTLKLVEHPQADIGLNPYARWDLANKLVPAVMSDAMDVMALPIGYVNPEGATPDHVTNYRDWLAGEHDKVIGLAKPPFKDSFWVLIGAAERLAQEGVEDPKEVLHAAKSLLTVAEMGKEDIVEVLPEFGNGFWVNPENFVVQEAEDGEVTIDYVPELAKKISDSALTHVGCPALKVRVDEKRSMTEAYWDRFIDYYLADGFQIEEMSELV